MVTRACTLAVLAFSPWALARAGSTGAVIPADAYWLYSQDRNVGNQRWTAPEYDDSRWERKRGPFVEYALNYLPWAWPDTTRLTKNLVGPTSTLPGEKDPKSEGEIPLRPFTTTYLRCPFEVKSLTAGLKVQLEYWPGIIVYVNGVEIFRGNMREGKVGYDDCATAQESRRGGSKTSKAEILLPAGKLRLGLNMLACELHLAGTQRSSAHPTHFKLEMVGGSSNSIFPVQPPGRTFVAWVADPCEYIFRDSFPDPRHTLPQEIEIHAAKNGYYSAQLGVRAADKARLSVTVSDLRSGSGAIPRNQVQVRYAGYVGWDDRNYLRPRYAPALRPDPLLSAVPLLEPGHSQAIWLTFHLPKEIKPGEYKGSVTVSCGSGHKEFPVRLVVYNVSLPDPTNFRFVLGAYEFPQILAQQYGVKPWSERHWQLLRVYFKDLASRGQKALIICVSESEWTPKGGSLVRWREKGGKLDWDYSVMDRYISLAEQELKPLRHIHLVNIGKLRSGDTAFSGVRIEELDGNKDRYLTFPVGSTEYQKMWGPFLQDLRKHLQEKGWYKLASLGVFYDNDTGKHEQAMKAMLRSYVPDFQVSQYSHMRGTDSFPGIQAYYRVHKSGRLPEARRGKNLDCLHFDKAKSITTLCRWRFLAVWHAYGLHCNGLTSYGYDGWYGGGNFLNRIAGTAGGGLAAMVTHNDLSYQPDFMVYPGEEGPISSIRWELLREGIQEYELLKMLEERGGTNTWRMLNEVAAIGLYCHGWQHCYTAISPQGAPTSVLREVSRQLLAAFGR